MDDFEASTDVRYRLTYDLRTANGTERVHFPGTVRMAQIEDDEFVLASLNCQNISQGAGSGVESQYYLVSTQ